MKIIKSIPAKLLFVFSPGFFQEEILRKKRSFNSLVDNFLQSMGRQYLFCLSKSCNTFSKVISSSLINSSACDDALMMAC